MTILRVAIADLVPDEADEVRLPGAAGALAMPGLQLWRSEAQTA